MQSVRATDPPSEMASLPLLGWMLSQVESKVTADRARELGLRVIISKSKPPQGQLAPFVGTSALAEPVTTGIQEETSFRKLFVDRKMGECAWICDEPSLEAICCAAPVVKGRSWCPHHTARVLRPAR